MPWCAGQALPFPWGQGDRLQHSPDAGHGGVLGWPLLCRGDPVPFIWVAQVLWLGSLTEVGGVDMMSLRITWAGTCCPAASSCLLSPGRLLCVSACMQCRWAGGHGWDPRGELAAHLPASGCNFAAPSSQRGQDAASVCLHGQMLRAQPSVQPLSELLGTQQSDSGGEPGPRTRLRTMLSAHISTTCS